jgi:hypothetical protein
VLALANQRTELAPQGLQVGQLAFDFRKMFARNYINRFARSVTLVGQVEQGSDLFNRES